jgi:hypothetical protein
MIFISYLRESQDSAELIHDRLRVLLPREWIFIDTDPESNPPGSPEWRRDFLRKLCTPPRALIAVIEPEWKRTVSDGSRRFKRRDRDVAFVCQELTWAYRSETPIFPVLMRGADMPKGANRLPEGAAEMVRGDGRVCTLFRPEGETLNDFREFAQVLGLEAKEQKEADESANRAGELSRGQRVIAWLCEDVDELRDYCQEIGILSAEQVAAYRADDEVRQKDESAFDVMRRAADAVPAQLRDEESPFLKDLRTKFSTPESMERNRRGLPGAHLLPGKTGARAALRRDALKAMRLDDKGGWDMHPDEKEWPLP